MTESDQARAVRGELSRIVAAQGPAVLDDPRMVRAMLSDAVAGATAEANLVGLAVSSGVPARLLAAGNDRMATGRAMDDAVRELERTSSVQHDDAVWVVGALAQALGRSGAASPSAPADTGPGPDELAVTAGGRTLTVRPGADTIVGRSPDSTIVLDSPAVSRHHGRFERRGATWFYADLQSTQGSFVDGVAVREVPIDGRVRIVLGQGGDAVAVDAVPGGVTRRTGDVPPPGPLRPPAPTVLPGGGGGPAPDRPGGPLAGGYLPATELGRSAPDLLTVTFAGATRTVAPGTALTIGRDPANDLVANEATVSRRHARIEHDSGAWHVRDLGTTSGTWSGGQRVSDAVLSGRQEFRLGDAVSGALLVLQATGNGAASGAPGRAPARDPRRRRLIVAIAAAVVVALVGGVTAWLLVRGGDGDSTMSNDELARATVRLSTDDGTGSGVIIDRSEGLILTNAHVAAPSAVGQAASGLTFADEQDPNPKEIEVSVSAGLGHAAEPMFTARVVAVDGYVDVAVVKIERTLSGSEVEAGDLDKLTQVRLGDSDSVQTSDPVSFFGYPGAANSKEPTFTNGVVSGAVKDGRLGTNRAAFNSTATISGGNSGGLATDRRGRMIGVPTWARLDRKGQTVFSSFRPINLAKPVIDAAEKNKAYTSPWSTAGPATAKVTNLRSATAKTPGSVDEGCTEGGSASGAFAIAMDATGFPGGKHTDVLAAVYEYTDAGAGDQVAIATTATEEDYPAALPSSGCLTFTFDSAVPDGRYLLKIGVGGDLRVIYSETFTLGA